MVGNEATDEAVIPKLPVIEYSHLPEAVTRSAAALCTTARLRRCAGKYLFTTSPRPHLGCDYKDMLAADDGKPDTMAKPREVKILWNGKVYDTMWPIKRNGLPRAAGRKSTWPANSRSPIRVAGTIVLRSDAKASCISTARATV